MVTTWLRRGEWAQSEQIAQTNSQIGLRIDELNDLGRHAGEFVVPPLPPKGDQLRPAVAGFLGDAALARWPGVAADTADARQLQLEAEIDALMALRSAFEDNLDPSEYLRSMAAQADELYGAADPRTLAYTDALAYYDHLGTVTRSVHTQQELDMLMLVRSELLAGRNPRVAIESLMEGFETGADAQRAQIVNFLAGSAFDITARIPEGMDTTDVTAAWRTQAAELRRQAEAMDTSTVAGAERAAALSEVAAALENAAFDVMLGNDPSNMLMRNIGSIELRAFSDGAGGADEAAALRGALTEYSMLVDEFRHSTLGESSLDFPGARRVARSTGDASGTTNIADLESAPPYSGLPEEFSRDELRLTIDPPNYADVFPQGIPDEFRQLLDLPEQVTDEVSTMARN